MRPAWMSDWKWNPQITRLSPNAIPRSHGWPCEVPTLEWWREFNRKCRERPVFLTGYLLRRHRIYDTSICLCWNFKLPSGRLRTQVIIWRWVRNKAIVRHACVVKWWYIGIYWPCRFGGFSVNPENFICRLPVHESYWCCCCY